MEKLFTALTLMVILATVACVIVLWGVFEFLCYLSEKAKEKIWKSKEENNGI